MKCGKRIRGMRRGGETEKINERMNGSCCLAPVVSSSGAHDDHQTQVLSVLRETRCHYNSPHGFFGDRLLLHFHL